MQNGCGCRRPTGLRIPERRHALAQWAGGIVECRVGDGGSLQAGSRLEQRVKKARGATGTRALDVTAVDAPRRLTFAGMMGPSPLRWGLDIAPIDGADTRVLLWVEAERRGPMRAIPAGLLRRMIRHVNAGELAAIRTALEATPNAGPAAAGA